MKTWKIILGILCVCFLLAGGGMVFLARHFNPAAVKPRVEKILSDAIQSPVTIQMISWRWLPQPYFLAEDVNIQRKEGPALDITEVRVKIDLRDILDKKIIVDEIEVYQPVITLTRDRKGRFLVPQTHASSSGTLVNQTAFNSFFVMDVHSLKVTDGQVHIKASSSFENPQATQITIDGVIDLSSATTTMIRPFNFLARVIYSGAEADVNLKGTIGTKIDIRVASTKAPIICFSEIFPIFRALSGSVDIDGNYVVGESAAMWNLHGQIHALSVKNRIDSPVANGKFHLGSQPPWNFSLNIESSTIQGVTAVVTKTVSGLHVDRMDIRVFGGEGTLSGDFTGQDFDAHWSGVNFDAVQMQNLLGLKNLISGRFNSVGELSGHRNPPDIKSFNGLFTVHIGSGALLGASGVLKFVSALNMTSLLKQGPKSGRNELAFDTLVATAAVKDGVLIFDHPATLTNKTLQMALMGKIDVPNKQIDAKVVINFLDLASEIIKSIPGVRTIILGGRKTLIPILANVKGPLNNPKVDVGSVESISKGAWNSVTSVLKFPVDLTKSLFSSKKKNQ